MAGYVHVSSRLRAADAVERARGNAWAALADLTERERAMFALALLGEVRTPALCELMGFISEQVKEHGARLRLAAIRDN